MLNKKLVLGSLAGATLLVGAAVMVPSSAEASMVSGTCSNCHTMHNSQNGAVMTIGTATEQDFLLRYNGCVGCHATATNNDNTGRDTSSPFAPQVDGGGAFATLGAGYFDIAGNANTSHSVTDLTFTNPQALATPPGGATDFSTGFTCTSCHGAVGGGHHGPEFTGSTRGGTAAAGDSYRFLRPDTDNDGTADGNYVSTTSNSAANYAVAGQANTGYTGSTATGMNRFCAACHGGFHGNTNTASDGLATATGNGPWVRHPTDVVTTGYGANYTTASDVPSVAISDANEVMCISCHRAHGSAQVDLLRFTYADVTAGDTTANVGCELCHGAK